MHRLNHTSPELRHRKDAELAKLQAAHATEAAAQVSRAARYPARYGVPHSTVSRTAWYRARHAAEPAAQAAKRIAEIETILNALEAKHTAERDKATADIQARRRLRRGTLPVQARRSAEHNASARVARALGPMPRGRPSGAGVAAEQRRNGALGGPAG